MYVCASVSQKTYPIRGLLHFIPFFLSSAQKSQKVVAVVDPCAAKFGDGVNIGHWCYTDRTTEK